MAKEACVLVLDIGRQVSAEDLEAGKNIVRMLVQQKLLFTKRDELGLLLVGTQGSRRVGGRLCTPCVLTC